MHACVCCILRNYFNHKMHCWNYLDIFMLTQVHILYIHTKCLCIFAVCLHVFVCAKLLKEFRLTVLPKIPLFQQSVTFSQLCHIKDKYICTYIYLYLYICVILYISTCPYIHRYLRTYVLYMQFAPFFVKQLSRVQNVEFAGMQTAISYNLCVSDD